MERGTGGDVPRHDRASRVGPGTGHEATHHQGVDFEHGIVARGAGGPMVGMDRHAIETEGFAERPHAAAEIRIGGEQQEL